MMVSTLLLAGVAQFVNPMIGTGNGGNTYPGPVWPNGMVQPGPDTSLVMKICLDTQDGPDGTVTLAEGELKDGVFEGRNRVKGRDGRERDVHAKIAFGMKPVAVRELKPNGRKGRRYILDFLVKPKQRVFVKAAVSSKSLEDARAKFAADDPSKNVYGWADAAKADWKAFFEAIPHDGTDAEHRAFYTDRYFEETK